jgi:hypothetical protein
MNITGTLPSAKLPIFFLKPNLTPKHAILSRDPTRNYTKSKIYTKEFYNKCINIERSQRCYKPFVCKF